MYLEAEVEHASAKAAVDSARGCIANGELGSGLHSWHCGHGGAEGEDQRQDRNLHLVEYALCQCIV